jgi:translation initiation factor 2 beta subunit (eIF-2beta)/eIF-5
MISAQIERLKRDSRELTTYGKKLEKKGRTDLVHKIMLKKKFIDQHIADVVSEHAKFN